MSGLDEGFCPCGNVIAANCACDAETLALVRSVWNMGLTTVGQKAGTVEAKAKALEWGGPGLGVEYAMSPFGEYKINLDGYWWFEDGPIQAKTGKKGAQADYEARIRSALIPAPSVAEAAEPVAQTMTVIDPDAWEPCSPAYLAAGGDCASAPRVWSAKEMNHWHPKLPAPPPVVPSGLEALEPAAFANAAFFTERRAEFEQNGTVVEARPRGMCMHPLYSADAIAALIAERDEAKRWRQEVEALSAQWMEETGQAYAYVGIRDYAAVKERAETAERALSAALTRIAEIEGVIQPFSDVAGEMFARGWNASSVALALDNKDDPHRVTAGDFFAMRRLAAAIRSSATKQEKADG